MEYEDDELVAECMDFEEKNTNKFEDCYKLFDQGMVFAAHQLMLKNIDGTVLSGTTHFQQPQPVCTDGLC